MKLPPINLKTMLMLFVLVLSILIAPCQTQALSIGVAPGILNVGEVYPGQSKLVEFYLITTADMDIIVSLSTISPHFDFYRKEQRGHYTFIPQESSNEEVRGWLSFPENPVAVSPKNVIIHTFPNGQQVAANKVVRAILKVPEDADPGYHVGAVNINPKLNNNNIGGGVATFAVSRFLYVFYVKPLQGQPEPKREGRITDIEAQRADDSRVRFDVLFQNTGTDTVLAKVSDMKVYDNFGELKTKLESGYKRVGPKETAVLSTFWSNDEAKGTHRVTANVDFLTGKAVADTEVTIPELTFVPSGQEFMPIGKSSGFPWWLLVVFVAITAVIAYFKSDWLWLIIILAIISAMIFIMGIIVSPPHVDLMNIPWWLIIVIIAAISLVVYWKS